jgi:GNAT superfamily N-acetyltransferase
MSISIRFGLPEERTELENLQRRASLAIERYRADLLAHPEAIHLPLAQVSEKRVRVAEIAGRIVGFSAVIPKAPQIFDLDGLFVEPDRWGSGIGRALITDAVQGVRAQGGIALEVLSNAVAEAFYEKLGFDGMGHVATPFGPGRLMRRAIQV